MNGWCQRFSPNTINGSRYASFARQATISMVVQFNETDWTSGQGSPDDIRPRSSAARFCPSFSKTKLVPSRPRPNFPKITRPRPHSSSNLAFFWSSSRPRPQHNFARPPSRTNEDDEDAGPSEDEVVPSGDP